ncbi:hypothetical protein [Pseudomonas asiatica]|uniref:hypothetical protein n=1 Tax=Pseudomonas asiatica TaxID=2219225 RepID=UPI00156B8C0E|nr:MULTISPECIES: hypothetical protein [Pseudomonas]CAB5614007.1 Uncharacterised protein [Pseudomonas putida]MBO2921716.1 hypothetical protein [Pseudomonas asiatica]WPU62061.1 hypothetical protein SQW15_08805 [Pseudomonas asiatica]CAB5645505.1 Uncharacterised protein [Pseudomonas putida]CAB5690483.1 Uncharacterised protein [Pseudomonas putida]
MTQNGVLKQRTHVLAQLSSLHCIEKLGTEPVAAGVPENTGEAGAMYRVVFFAGEPAPTGIAVTFSFAQYQWERL